MASNHARGMYGSSNVNIPGGGRSVVFVDTPGFDATSRSDTDTLFEITEWLVKMWCLFLELALIARYKNNTRFASIIYLHRISDSRMAELALKDLELFSKLYGQKALPSVIFATTMWNTIDRETALRRQKELEDGFSKEMGKGCRTAYFDTTFASAWDIDIVWSLDDESNKGATLDIQEMAVSGKMLHETIAFEPVCRRH